MFGLYVVMANEQKHFGFKQITYAYVKNFSHFIDF